MGGWHHWLNGHEFGQTLGDSEGHGSLACCSPWGHKELGMTGQMNNKQQQHIFSKKKTWETHFLFHVIYLFFKKTNAFYTHKLMWYNCVLHAIMMEFINSALSQCSAKQYGPARASGLGLWCMQSGSILSAHLTLCMSLFGDKVNFLSLLPFVNIRPGPNVPA